MHLNNPKTAVTRNITQISTLTVNRSNDNALSWMRFHHSTVGRTVFVIAGRKERLHFLDVGFLHSCKFSDFHCPKSLQFFRTGLVIHIRKGQCFGIILRTHKVFHNGGLTNTLLTVKHENAVKLDAGNINTGNSGCKGFSCNRAYILLIIRLQIFNKEVFHTLHTIPLRQTVKIVTDRVEVPIISNLGKSNIMVTAGKRQIADVNDRLKLCRICITPECISCRTLPRERTCNLNTVCHLIEGKVSEIGVIV